MLIFLTMFFLAMSYVYMYKMGQYTACEALNKTYKKKYEDLANEVDEQLKDLHNEYMLLIKKNLNPDFDHSSHGRYLCEVDENGFPKEQNAHKE